jgi:hypothetical protein
VEHGLVTATPKKREVVEPLDLLLHRREGSSPRRRIAQEARPQHAERDSDTHDQADGAEAAEAQSSPDGHRYPTSADRDPA